MAPSPEELKAQADADRENGLKAMKAGNYERAVQLLGKCLENLVVLHGEVAPECAYTYFKYGTALFYKSQEDADVMGSETAAKKAAEAKKEKLTAEKGGASEPGTSEKGEEEEAPQSSNGDKASEGAADAVPDRKGKGPAKAEEAAAEGEDEDEEDEEGGGVDQEEEIGEEDEVADDESDLALAWQVLESARVIYEKMPARSLDEADVIMTLADISLEKEEFANCVSDYHHAIGLLHALLPPYHRRIAEAYFRLCLAHQTAQQPIEALASCRKAIESCNLCVQHLKAQIGGTAPGPEGASDPARSSHGVQGPEHSEGGAPTEPAEASKSSDGMPNGAAVAAGAGSASATLSVASGEASSSAASEPGAAVTRREEALKDLEEVEAVVGDLKEKEAEIVEMLSNPSLQHLLASAAAKASVEPAKGAQAQGTEPGGEAAITGQAAAVPSKGIVSGNAQNADQGVAVVGRGKKRVAPTPVDPALPSDAKRLC